MSNLTEAKLRLASASPRRAELLQQAGIPCVVSPSRVEEHRLPEETPEAYVWRLSQEKARSVWADHAGLPILAADTVVVLEDRVLEKPGTEAEAVAMLQALSGGEHWVMTAFTLLHESGEETQLVRTRVAFRDLSDLEIHTYVKSGEPFDKAGGYGIQSGAGHMVRRIEGSYTNVVGLPMAEVMDVLKKLA